MDKRALITGISGQDGAYLSQLLLEQGYQVYGARRQLSSTSDWRLQHLGIADQVEMVPFDLLDIPEAIRTLQRIRPQEVYNLGAHSFVATSFSQPLHTAEVDGLGVVRLLEVIRTVDDSIRFYQASTSEMFGFAEAIPQSETTRFHPRSPYGVAKLFGHWSTVNYRECFGLHASSGILFNHESPLRGEEYVTRKITRALARIKLGLQDHLALGNLDSKRDWGYAADYVRGMWQMLQQDVAGDYVLSSGIPHSVRQFVEAAASHLDIEIDWEGSGLDERGFDRASGKPIVVIDPQYYRPSDPAMLLGDPTKARTRLGWNPQVHFEELVRLMVANDYDMAGANR